MEEQAKNNATCRYIKDIILNTDEEECAAFCQCRRSYTYPPKVSPGLAFRFGVSNRGHVDQWKHCPQKPGPETPAMADAA